MRYSDNFNFKLPEAATDNVNIEDLNDNFEEIDGAFADVGHVVTGTYTGNSSYMRTLTFEKDVIYIYIVSGAGDKCRFGFNPKVIDSELAGTCITITSDGAYLAEHFMASNEIHVGNMNEAGTTYAYMAIFKGVEEE